MISALAAFCSTWHGNPMKAKAWGLKYSMKPSDRADQTLKRDSFQEFVKTNDEQRLPIWVKPKMSPFTRFDT
jgi:hypothetical protein